MWEEMEVNIPLWRCLTVTLVQMILNPVCSTVYYVHYLVLILSTINVFLCLLTSNNIHPGLRVQFQKQGKDVERVKQRLAEIANYVDKVKPLPSQCTGEIYHMFKIEIPLPVHINIIPD